MNAVSKGTAQILRISVENVPALWDQIAPMLATVLRRTPTHDVDDVFTMCMGHMAHCWAQIIPETVEVQAVVITDFEATPNGVWLRAWLGGVAPGQRMDVQAFHDATMAWTKTQRCRGMVILGRAGWVRHFPQAQVEGLLLRITHEPE